MSLQEDLHRAHKERLLRMRPKPKVAEPKPEPKPLPVVEFDTMEAWIARQKSIPLPPPKEPWFSMVSDFDISGPTIEKIIFATAQYFNLPTKDLRGTYRTASIAYARQVAFYLCRTLTVRSFPEIGQRFGGRDHTTVLHGYPQDREAVGIGLDRCLRHRACGGFDMSRREQQVIDYIRRYSAEVRPRSVSVADRRAPENGFRGYVCRMLDSLQRKGAIKRTYGSQLSIVVVSQ